MPIWLNTLNPTPGFKDAASRSQCAQDPISQTPALEGIVSQHLRTLVPSTQLQWAQGLTLGGRGGGVASAGVGLEHKDGVSW